MQLSDIVVKSGMIHKILPAKGYENDSDIYDAAGKVVCPGFVDIHTHGIFGYDITNVNEDEIADMAKEYYKAGSTTFIPSIPTVSSDKVNKTLEIYSKFRQMIPGIHMEGPYINVEKRGAQNPLYITRPTISAFKTAVDGYEDIVLRVTLAPEKDIGFTLTDYLVSKGIKVSFGHTMSDAATANAFFDRNDSIATHLFNAMPSIHHRKPMITTIALTRDNVMCEIIPDLIHVHPEVIKMVFKIKGCRKTIAVSDSMLAAGLPDGEYELGGLSVTVEKDRAILKEGNLAGSIITLAKGIKNLIDIGIEPEEALASGTSTPAAALGLEKKCGFIKEGYAADIVILDKKYSLVSVFKNGLEVI